MVMKANIFVEGFSRRSVIVYEICSVHLAQWEIAPLAEG